MSRTPNREFDRGERVGAELLRELTVILRASVKDPRLAEITLQEVRVSRDLSYARVFFTCFPTDDCGDSQQRLLNGTLAGFLRRELAHRTRLRTVPQLKFVHDESVRDGERLSALIDRAVADDAPDDSDAPR